MAYDNAYSSTIGVAYEDTYGTVETTGFVDPLLLDGVCNIDESQNVQEEHGTGSRKANQLSVNNYSVSGSLSGKLQGGRMIAYALGTDTVTGTDPYTHTFAQADTPTGTLSSFTLEKGHENTDKAQRVAGCKINDFSLNLDVGGQLTGTFNYTGQEVSKVTSSVASRTQSTSNVFTSWMGSLTWNSAAIEVTAFTFNYNNNLSTEDYSVGERRIKSLTEGQISMSGSFTLVFSDFTVYDDFQSDFSTATSNELGTERNLGVLIDNGGTTTAEREMAFTLGDVYLSEVGNATTLDNGRIVSEYSYIPKSINSFTFKDGVSVDYITND